MYPFLIRHGNFTIPTFSFMLMMASLAATFYLYYRAPGKKLSQTAVLDLGIIGTIAGVVGSRLFHVLVEEPRYYWEHPTHIYQIWRGGFVSYGAIILIGISFYIYMRSRKLDALKYLDFMALSFPIVIFFVRVGCLGAGCCYGKPTHFFIHLVFHNPSSDAGYKYPGIPLHATQVYGMLNAIFLFIALHWLDKRKTFDGQIVWSFVMLYGFTRGLQEFLRGDVERGVYFNGMISTAQIMGILGIIFGAFMYRYCRHRALQKSQGSPPSS
jgi:phosphatidylglycerol---prolipoprotein diacylglyceryl transferase